MASTNGVETQDGSVGPVYIPSPSLKKRIGLFVEVWLIKTLVAIIKPTMRVFHIRGVGSLKPTYTKRYPVGARLENHVWLPSTYQQGTALPLYIDIHGGGFVLGDPDQDAPFCQHFAEKYGICVVSVNYRKAPRAQFPQPVQDLTEIVQAVIEDPDLPVDKTRIAMGGFSAGGNLALSISQKDELQGKIAGLLVFYPPTDFSRRYRGPYMTHPDGSPDLLKRMAPVFDYAYLPPGVDRADPYLSPIYAKRSRLPSKIFILGAQYDILVHEARKTAELYAQAEGAEKNGDDTFWTAGNISWKMVSNVKHGFNFLYDRIKDEKARAELMKVTEDMYAETAEWLKREVYT